ncbi:hypothetical protein WNY98_11160 [Pseudoalteromonas sp. AS71]|uniref:hypothetical protein n=1 Tax=Pseudoalteromonas sp. AS71 TaxID=3135777 RepID=UPI00316FFB04
MTLLSSNKNERVSLWKRILNSALLFSHIVLLLGISVIAFDRERFKGISDATYGDNALLMESNLADIFVSPWFAYLCLALIPIALIKERLLKSYNLRIYLNALASLIFGAMTFIFIVNLYRF